MRSWNSERGERGGGGDRDRRGGRGRGGGSGRDSYGGFGAGSAPLLVAAVDTTTTRPSPTRAGGTTGSDRTLAGTEYLGLPARCCYIESCRNNRSSQSSLAAYATSWATSGVPSPPNDALLPGRTVQSLAPERAGGQRVPRPNPVSHSRVLADRFRTVDPVTISRAWSPSPRPTVSFPRPSEGADRDGRRDPRGRAADPGPGVRRPRGFRRAQGQPRQGEDGVPQAVPQVAPPTRTRRRRRRRRSSASRGSPRRTTPSPPTTSTTSDGLDRTRFPDADPGGRFEDGAERPGPVRDRSDAPRQRRLPPGAQLWRRRQRPVDRGQSSRPDVRRRGPERVPQDHVHRGHPAAHGAHVGRG